MGASFKNVRNDAEIDLCAALAADILNEYLAARKDGQCCEASKDKSRERMLAKMDESYEYYLLQDAEQCVGLLSIQPQEAKTLLAKLYLSENQRGKGYASDVFSFLEGFCQGRHLDAIWLNVCKNNFQTIESYKIKGFSTVRMGTQPMEESGYMEAICGCGL